MLFTVQVVYGGELPSPPNHLPTLSFDENGGYSGHLRILGTFGEDEHGVEKETGKENLQPLLKDQQAAFIASQTARSFPSVSGFSSYKPTLPGRDSASVMPSGLSVFGQNSTVSGQSLGFSLPPNAGAQTQLQVGTRFSRYTVKSHFKALGLYNFIRGFGWAYKWGGLYPDGLISGIIVSLANGWAYIRGDLKPRGL